MKKKISKCKEEKSLILDLSKTEVCTVYMLSVTLSVKLITFVSSYGSSVYIWAVVARSVGLWLFSAKEVPVERCVVTVLVI